MNGGDFDTAVGFELGFATSIVDDVLDSGKGYASGPERALLSALLFDGIQAYINYMLAETPKERSKFIEAQNWVTDRSTEYAFSFDNVCEALGINSEYLRLGLLNATSSLLAEVGKSRRNF